MRKKNPTNYSKKTRKYVITFFFFFENGFLDFYLHFFFLSIIFAIYFYDEDVFKQI